MSRLRIFVHSLLTLGFLVLLHQWLNWGRWFELGDIHHETFAVACFASALTLSLYERRRSRGGMFDT